jgi:molybdopterin synthase sulfur carrier subunit
MIIKVKGYLTFNKLLGERSVEVNEGTTLLMLIDKVAKAAGPVFADQVMDKQGRPRQQVAVVLHGRHYTHLPDGLETRLEDGDEVAIFPPIMGG